MIRIATLLILVVAAQRLCYAADDVSLNHRLAPGDSLNLEIDAARVLHKDVPEMRGISSHSITGWMRHPYEVGTAKYQLEPQIEEAMRELRLPMSRIHMGFRKEDPLPVERSIELIAELYGKFKVPQETIIVTFPNEFLADAEKCAALVKHSLDKGFKFRNWELGNEPWHPTVPKAMFNQDPNVYVAQVKAVSAAIRKVQPEAKIGVAVNENPKSPWSGVIVEKAAGSYDWVAGHHYAFSRFYKCSFEGMALVENWLILNDIIELNGQLKKFNAGRDAYQYDSEWGQHSKGYNAKGEPKEPAVGPMECVQNGNIMGTLHRAVRLIYYTREELMRGASSWEMLSREKEPGFAILTRDAPDKRGMIYWLYHTFSRHVGRDILELKGTAPYYTATTAEHLKIPEGQKVSGPLTPALASFDPDNKRLYLIVVNGSWTKTVPCAATIANFDAKEAEALILSHDNLNGSAWVAKKEDLISKLPVELKSGALRCDLPPHSVAFITVK